MTYAYDDYVQMPTKDLYDTAVMKMAIEAAKDMYDKGQAQMENFYKTYGDFMSPFARDMQKYGEAMKYVRDTINDAYARGIDLFKSPEGRSIIAQLSHSVDPTWYNTAKANAKLGYKYLDAIQEAAAKGQYSQEMQDWYLNRSGLGRFEDFSSDSGKMWNAAPIQYKSMEDIISPLVDKLDPTFDAEMTARLNDGFDYNTVSRDRIMQTINDNLNDLVLADPAGGFYYDQALKQAGGDKDAAMGILKNWFANRANKFVKVERKENPYKMYDYKSRKDLEEYRQKSAIDRVDNLLEKYDFNLNGKLDPDEREIAKRYLTKSIKGPNKEDTPNVFREAEAYAPEHYKAHTPNGTIAGTHAGYMQSKSYSQKIDTVVPSNSTYEKNKDTGEDRVRYQFAPSEIKDNVFIIDGGGKVIPSQLEINSDTDVVTFNPHGNMKAARYKNGYKYYISGTFTNNEGDAIVDPETGSDTVWIEVKERAFDYDK